MATPFTEVGGSQIQASSGAAAAVAAGLAPELPTEIPDVRNLAFFKAEDAQYLAKFLKEGRDRVDRRGDERVEDRVPPAQNREWHPPQSNCASSNHR